jgi:hypothetical protein
MAIWIVVGPQDPTSVAQLFATDGALGVVAAVRYISRAGLAIMVRASFVRSEDIIDATTFQFGC